MDLFLFDKAENISSPISKCNVLLHMVAKLFRFIELCFLILFLSWSLSRLPIAADYIGKLLGFFATPLFGFLLCNAIIVALVAKPSQFSHRSREADRIYEHLIPKSSSISEEVEIVYQDKQIIAEVISSIHEAKSANVESESGLDHLELSSEAFQRKIEAFIAKEKKFRREESSAIVTPLSRLISGSK